MQILPIGADHVCGWLAEKQPFSELSRNRWCNVLNLTKTIQIPVVGFGTYLINADEAKNFVFNSLQCGYRHVDTAGGYGNETGVGYAIKKAQ